MKSFLAEVCKRHETDKITKHNYVPTYEKYMEHNREEVATVLEIGIYQGQSLKAWRDYFPNAQIIGLDIDTKTHINEPRITSMYLDQSDVNSLAKVRQEFKARAMEFDYIIDDGSHTWSHQIMTFLMFKDLLTDRGKYFIEDIYVNSVDGKEEYPYKPIIESFKDFAIEVYDGREKMGLHDEVMMVLEA